MLQGTVEDKRSKNPRRVRIIDVSDKSPERTWGTFSTGLFPDDLSTLKTCSTTFVGSVGIRPKLSPKSKQLPNRQLRRDRQ